MKFGNIDHYVSRRKWTLIWDIAKKNIRLLIWDGWSIAQDSNGQLVVTNYLIYAAFMTIFDYPKCLLNCYSNICSFTELQSTSSEHHITLRAFCNFNPSGLLHKGLVLISPGGAPFYDCRLNWILCSGWRDLPPSTESSNSLIIFLLFLF